MLLTCKIVLFCSAATVITPSVAIATEQQGSPAASEQQGESRVPRKKVVERRKQQQKRSGSAGVAPETPQEVLRGDAAPPEVSAGASERLAGDIVVYGLKENVQSARNAKRKAQQIVDVILSQDIGKLPDKNVPEALARVPGVFLDRERGEGSSIRIRGLDNVMTTVNGANSFSAGDRTSYLNDIQSDLVAGIEVFKTRTPDQIEGSNSGVVNLTMRRPADFKNGATYAFQLRGDYNDQVKRTNPYGSAMVSYSGDTAIGRMGFLVNGTYNNMAYVESRRYNEFPGQPGDVRQLIGPTNTPTPIFLPSRVEYRYRRGERERAAFNISTEWRPSDQLRFLIEGAFSNTRQGWFDDSFWLPLTYSDSRNPPPRLTNVVLSDDGRLVKSLTAEGTDPIGPGKNNWLHRSTDYSARFQVDYNTEQFEFGGWIGYRKATNNSNDIRHWIRFNQQPSFDVEFNTQLDPRGGPNAVFKNIDLMDPANYQFIDGFQQTQIWWNSYEKEARYDMKIFTFDDTIDYIKIGFRAANRFYDRRAGGRLIGGLRVPISELPGYTLTPVGQGFQGTTTGATADWLIGDGAAIRSNWDLVRAIAMRINPAQTALQQRWPTFDQGVTFNGNEGSYAGYGMLHYNMKFILPIEGVVGLRIVNSYTNLFAFNRTTTRGVVDGRPGNVLTVTPSQSANNFLDLMPSVNAIMHFTPELQLRLSWTRDVWRPNAEQLRPSVNFDLTNPNNLVGNAGNEQLQGVPNKKLDASIEYYFGKTGSISLAGWYWRQDGFLISRQLPEIIDDQTLLITRPYNANRSQSAGVEASATTFFTFLPGIFRSFGISGNFTYNDTKNEVPVFDGLDITRYVNTPRFNVSKYLFNVIGMFERDGLNIRLAYNWQSRRILSASINNPYDNRYFDPVDRLDLSFNYDISKFLTVSVDAANLTRSGVQEYYGSPELPREITYFARNITAGVRLRF